MGIYRIGDLQRLETDVLENTLGKWGLALAGKARGEDAGAWFAGEVGEDEQAKSVSHEHTFNEDTANLEKLESTLLRLCEMVARRLREQDLAGRTWQLKLRYSDFSTITRAHSLPGPTTVDSEIFTTIRKLSNFDDAPEQMDLLQDEGRQKWARAISASDKLRDKYGDSAVFLAKGMRGGFREKVHENPAEKPDKKKPAG